MLIDLENTQEIIQIYEVKKIWFDSFTEEKLANHKGNVG